MLVANPRLDRFVSDMRTIVEHADGREEVVMRDGRKLLAALVSDDSWYPDALAEPESDRFTQYMLHRADDGRLTVLGVVWAPGASAPPHDHTTWGLIGQLRGVEVTRFYDLDEGGGGLSLREELVLRPGEATALSPSLGDIHDVRNPGPDVAVSIHVYGADLEALAHRRSRYDTATGTAIPFEAEYH